jgi:hypothetical protein
MKLSVLSFQFYRRTAPSFIAVLFLVTFSRVRVVEAQTQAMKWEKSFGGSMDDAAESVINTKDGGFLVIGSSSSADDQVTNFHGGNDDVWLTKLDSLGNLQWANAYGGTGDDEAYSVVQTSDSGYIFAGKTNSNNTGDVTGFHGGNFDAWICKIDSIGKIQWEQTFGGVADDRAYSIVQLEDGAYVFAGTSNSVDGTARMHKGKKDFWVVKLDQTGQIIWNDDFGGSQDDIAYQLIETRDHGFAVVGATESLDGDVNAFHGLTDVWLIRLDTLGNMVWNKSYGGGSADAGNSVCETSDGGFAVAGYSSSHDGDVSGVHGLATDFWAFKTDAMGNLKWQHAYGGTNNDFGTAIVQTDDGGFGVAGYITSSDGDVIGLHSPNTADFWLLKLDGNGALEWQRTLGGTDEDECNSVTQLPNGGLVLAGYSMSFDGDVTGVRGGKDFWVLELQPPCFDIRLTLADTSYRGKNQETVLIPIYSLDSSVRPLQSLDLTLLMNLDVLTPVGIDNTQGQFTSCTILPVSGSNSDSITLHLVCAGQRVLRPGLICVVKCIANLSKSLTTPVSIGQADFIDSLGSSKCLHAELQSIPNNDVKFDLEQVCGDSTISEEMKGDLLSIQSVVPNPATSFVDMIFHLPVGYRNDAVIQVLDEIGTLLKSEALTFLPGSTTGKLHLSLPVGSGVLYLRTVSNASVCTQKVVINK